jgi:CubicO group peptidase (beta-lactamase class C family)
MSSCGVGDDAQQADRLGQLETFARTAQQQWDVPGMAIAIVKNDEVIYAKGFGVKRVGGTEPVDADTVFEIGSTSKAFTAAVVALQVDDGKVGWSDRVIDHLPAFEMRDPWVTREFQVADLMAQHSGMPAYAGDGMAFLGFPADYIVAHMKHLDPVTGFRSEFAYVNNLFLVAGDLARATSGKTWAENVQQRVFDPLRHAVELVRSGGLQSGGKCRCSAQGRGRLGHRVRRRRSAAGVGKHVRAGRRHQLHGQGHGAVAAYGARQRTRLEADPREDPCGRPVATTPGHRGRRLRRFDSVACARYTARR